MIVSYAIEPVTSVFNSSAPLSRKKQIHPVADGAQAAGVEIHAQRRVGARAYAACDLLCGNPSEIVGRHENALRHRFIAFVSERKLECGKLLRELDGRFRISFTLL